MVANEYVIKTKSEALITKLNNYSKFQRKNYVK